MFTVIKLYNAVFERIYKLYKLLYYTDFFLETFLLSIMSERQLANLTRQFYHHNKKYITEDNIRSGLKDFEKHIFEKYIPASASEIVILAAGGGREIYSLTKMGYKCYGYESTEKFVTVAADFFKKNEIDARIIHFPVNKVPQHSCDVFIFGWGVYTHLSGESLRVKLLEDAKNNLRENGKIIISFWASNEWMEMKKRLMEKYRRIFGGKFECGSCIKTGCWGKYYTQSEIEDEARKAGLKVDYYSDQRYGHAVLSVE
ncbi:MAG: hypothetical protein LBD45_08910 [Bacteroidales bacterium]|jgi:hypothetical protein|nr:hypothetical protein [Bacteroidales bacterium]